MLEIDNSFQGNQIPKSFISLGSFDGLHMGHLGLIRECIRLSQEYNGQSMVYTFTNHPLTLVNPEKVPKLLIDNKAKLDILRKIGVDIACFINFNKEFMELSPEDFILQLINKFSMKGLVVGFNYRFGHKNSGDVELLKQLSIKYNFYLSIIEPLSFEGELVSSSRIRDLLINGDVEKANEMLFQPFMLRGTVISGKQLGRKIGYPTANILVDERYVIPKVGVYYTNVKIDNKLYRGMTNVGFNPTVEETQNVKVETYIVDFDEDIYGKEIEIYFIDRMRDEEKFSKLEDLIYQMNKDYNYIISKKFVVFDKK